VKMKEAHSLLAQYNSEELYHQACQLYREESDGRIALRAHSKEPTGGIVQSVVDEMKDWFRKVAVGLAWEDSEVPENIIGWESSAIYVKYRMVDAQIEDYRKRTRLEVLRGTPLPLLEAMKPGDLDALSGMILAQIRQDACRYLELEEKRKRFAEKLGKPICPYGVEERFCPRQESYSMAEGLPTSVNDLVFVCTVDKCIKESG